MQQLEIQTYKRRIVSELKKGASISARFKKALTFENLLASAILILLSRTLLLGGIAPFGVAFFSSYVARGNAILLIPSLIIGVLVSGVSQVVSVKYIVVMAFYSLFALRFSSVVQKNSWAHIVMLNVALIGANIGMMLGRAFYLYDAMMLFVEISICTLSVYAYDRTHSIIPRLKLRGQLRGSEILCGALTIGVALLGVRELLVINGFSIINTLFVAVILICAHQGGAALSTGVGVILGILAGAESGIDIVAAFAFAGLLCGYAGKLGKISTALTFIVANFLVTVYTSGSTYVLIGISETLLASAVFLMIPRKHLNRLGECLKIKETTKYSNETKNLSTQINEYAACYKELGCQLFTLSEKMAAPTALDASSIYDRVTSKICADCSLGVFCWKQEFAKTYQAMNDMLEIAERASGISEIVLPEYFSTKCRHPHEFLQTFRHTYELYRLDRIWQQRLNDARYALSKHLDLLGSQLEGLIANVQCEKERLLNLEQEVERGLSEMSIFHNSLSVHEENGRIVTTISLNETVEQDISYKLEEMLSEIFHIRMECLSSPTQDGQLRFVEAERFILEIGAAATSKSGGSGSGDSFCHARLADGCYAIALSDGMGSGELAARQSNVASSMLIKLLRAGFERLAAINLVNSLLICKSVESSFATIDLSIVDLKNGNIEFFKSGAAPAYICRDRIVDVCMAQSLPAGLLTDADVEKNEYTIFENDCIVLMTDGAFSETTADKYDYSSIISQSASLSANEIARALYRAVLSTCKGKPSDDLTVICAKLLPNPSANTQSPLLRAV